MKKTLYSLMLYATCISGMYYANRMYQNTEQKIDAFNQQLEQLNQQHMLTISQQDILFQTEVYYQALQAKQSPEKQKALETIVTQAQTISNERKASAILTFLSLTLGLGGIKLSYDSYQQKK
ncbi:MAG: hypothetical protein QW594_01185 [Candidatus Woesearchaeota archaeon]